MRTHNLTKFFNALLVLLALIIIYISWKNLSFLDPSYQLNLDKLIGKISEHKNTVQLKHPEQLAWTFVSKENENKLIENDSLFTHIDSQATVTLENEQKITVQSESLIRLKSAQKIQVQAGEVDLHIVGNQPAITLQIGRQVYQVSSKENSKLTIKREFNKSVFDVKSGNVSLKSAKNQLDLKSGTITQVKGDDATSVEQATLLLYPKDTVILKRGSPLRFKFETEAKIEQVYIERNDRSFSISPDRGINLRAGMYKWGVIYKDLTRPLVLQDFKLILEDSPPIPKSPVHRGILQRSTENKDVIFTWESSQTVLFELLDEHEKVLHSDVTSSNSITLPMIEPGKYFWRTKIQNEFIQSVYSKPSEFFLNLVDEQSEYFTIEIKKPNQLINITIADQANLEEQLKNSHILVSDSKDFKHIIIKKKVEGPKIQFRAKTPGFYYWKIINPNGNIKLKKVLVVPTPAPMKAPKIKNFIKKIKSSFIQKILNLFISSAFANDNLIEVNWDAIKDAKEYEIEIINNLKDKKVIQLIKSSKPSFSWTAPANKIFYYRVRYKDFWDRHSPYSDYAQILLQMEAKKSQPVTKAVEKEVENIRGNKNIIDFYYTYSQVNFEQQLSSGSKLKIEGANITGHALDYKRLALLESSLNFSLSYKSRYGKVFNEQDFYQRQLSLNATKVFGMFEASLGASYINYALYSSSQGATSKASDFNDFALMSSLAMTNKLGKNAELNPFIQAHFLNFQQFQIGLNYRYHFDNSYIWTSKLLLEKTDFSEENLDISGQTFQLFTGLSFIL